MKTLKDLKKVLEGEKVSASIMYLGIAQKPVSILCNFCHKPYDEYHRIALEIDTVMLGLDICEVCKMWIFRKNRKGEKNETQKSN